MVIIPQPPYALLVPLLDPCSEQMKAVCLYPVLVRVVCTAMLHRSKIHKSQCGIGLSTDDWIEREDGVVVCDKVDRPGGHRAN